jgi:hypothetical protein
MLFIIVFIKEINRYNLFNFLHSFRLEKYIYDIYTMGLANAAKRARFYTSTTNQPQGGGNKKAGFPYQIGRTSWTPIFL